MRQVLRGPGFVRLLDHEADVRYWLNKVEKRGRGFTTSWVHVNEMRTHGTSVVKKEPIRGFRASSAKVTNMSQSGGLHMPLEN